MSVHRAEPRIIEAGSGSTTPPARGRRCADVPVDHVVPAGPSAYVGRRRAAVAADAPAPDRTLDTGTIERVLSALEPVDHTTSFEREETARIPLLRADAPPAAPGKRRATKRGGNVSGGRGRGPLVKVMPSAPVLLGIAALALSVGGAVTVNDDAAPAASPDAISHATTQSASALGGDSGQGRVFSRKNETTRDGANDARADAAGQDLQAAAEATAQERNTELKLLAGRTEQYAKFLAKDVWEYPLQSVVLTARFGQYGLWSSYHTGLDFNGNSGDPISSITNGEVISASYDGAYGNKTVVRLEDGTEIWYCHQTSFAVSVGDTVTRGEIIGTVGATGHVTGSHLHVEVRPGGGDPVDPYTAMQQHGLF